MYISFISWLLLEKFLAIITGTVKDIVNILVLGWRPFDLEYFILRQDRYGHNYVRPVFFNKVSYVIVEKISLFRYMPSISIISFIKYDKSKCSLWTYAVSTDCMSDCKCGSVTMRL